MFLPIIISKPNSSQFSSKYVCFYIQNVGHGVALRPKYRMLGINEIHTIEGYLSSETNIREKKPLDFLDHRVSQGFHYLAFDLSTTKFDVLKDSKLELEILYNDVFTRHIKTTYDLTLVKQDQYHIFQLDNLQVHLP